MKITKRHGLRGLVLMISILSVGMMTAPAEAGPFERLFRAMRHGFNEPQHKSSSHHGSHKQGNSETDTSSGTPEQSASGTTNIGSGKPPSERNTRSTTRATTKKGDDMPYGTPVPGKQGFVTSPFSPNAGYIDVRGFAPGTPVKDPYTNKIFLTP